MVGSDTKLTANPTCTSQRNWLFLHACSFPSSFTGRHFLAQLSGYAAEALLTVFVESRCNNINTRAVVGSDNGGAGFTSPTQAACRVFRSGIQRKNNLQTPGKLFCLLHLLSSASGCSQDEPLSSLFPPQGS